MQSLLLQHDPAAPLHVVCLGAHSDDIEIGCGATLHTLLARYPNLRVTWVVFSANGPRATEARTSARRYLKKVEHTLLLETFRDGFFPAQFTEIKERFESLKALGAPDLVFTHAAHDKHQDHRTVQQLTWNTWRNTTILEYEIPKWDADLGAPNCYVPVDARAAKKKVEGLMKDFGTQRSKAWFDEETFYGLLRIRGLECAAPSRYAEGFYARKFTLG